MSTYRGRTRVNYRKIYEDHFGPIPVDELGRSYHIHHLDGNDHNNDPSNLIALSPQEHYDVHFVNGDYHACWKMKLILALSHEQISDLAILNAEKRVQNGTHNFLGDQNPNSRRVKDGTHNFLGDNNPNRKRAALGLQSERVKRQQEQRIKEGTHHWLGGEYQRRQVQKQIAEGRNVFIGDKNPNKRQVTCPHCGVTGGYGGLRRWHFDNCKGKA